MASPLGSKQFKRITLLNSTTNLHESATIRWQGRLQPSKDTVWVGLEYDDECKGKHSGLFKNFQLFNTFFSREGGSFMKDEVLKNKIIENESNFTRTTTFYQSLRANYPDFFTDGERDFKLDYINIGGKEVENVGIKYKVKKLNSITLRNEMIYLSDLEENKILKIPDTLDLEWLKSVSNLDLSMNFVNSLEHLDGIIFSILPNLRWLSLSGNDIDFSKLCLPKHCHFPSFSKLTDLHLNSTNISFTDLDRLITFLPNIKKLELMDNLECFDQQNLLDQNLNVNESLQSLDISFNRDLTLLPWQFITMFPNLERLNASVCNIDDDLLDSSENHGCFQNLKELNLRTRPFLGHFACLGLALLFEGVSGDSVTLYVDIMHPRDILEVSFSLFSFKKTTNDTIFQYKVVLDDNSSKLKLIDLQGKTRHFSKIELFW